MLLFAYYVLVNEIHLICLFLGMTKGKYLEPVQSSSLT